MYQLWVVPFELRSFYALIGRAPGLFSLRALGQERLSRLEVITFWGGAVRRTG